MIHLLLNPECPPDAWQEQVDQHAQRNGEAQDAAHEGKRAAAEIVILSSNACSFAF